MFARIWILVAIGTLAAVASGKAAKVDLYKLAKIPGEVVYLPTIPKSFDTATISHGDGKGDTRYYSVKWCADKGATCCRIENRQDDNGAIAKAMAAGKQWRPDRKAVTKLFGEIRFDSKSIEENKKILDKQPGLARDPSMKTTRMETELMHLVSSGSKTFYRFLCFGTDEMLFIEQLNSLKVFDRKKR